MLFHELSENLVLAPELGFQHGDPLPLGVGPGAAGPLETRRSVLEQGLLPAVELRGLDALSRFSGNWTIAEFSKRLPSVVVAGSIARFLRHERSINPMCA